MMLLRWFPFFIEFTCNDCDHKSLEMIETKPLKIFGGEMNNLNRL